MAVLPQSLTAVARLVKEAGDFTRNSTVTVDWQPEKQKSQGYYKTSQAGFASRY
jgi:hypothetical protein